MTTSKTTDKSTIAQLLVSSKFDIEDLMKTNECEFLSKYFEIIVIITFPKHKEIIYAIWLQYGVYGVCSIK
jgi:hypothetical protein